MNPAPPVTIIFFIERYLLLYTEFLRRLFADGADFFCKNPTRFAVKHKIEPEEKGIELVDENRQIVQWIVEKDVKVKWKYSYVGETRVAQDLSEAVLGPTVVVIEVPGARFSAC